MAAERMLGMEVPPRAVWLRTLMAELNRVLNHLMFLGSYPLEIGAITPVFYAFREREAIQAVMEEATGGRMHFMFNRVGGIREEVPAGWTDRVRRAVVDVRARLGDLERLIRRNERFLARTRGDKTPWRMKLRSASYNNIQALQVLLAGRLIPDLVAILGSMFFVVGDIDK